MKRALVILVMACDKPPGSAVLVETFCQNADGPNAKVDWITLVEFGVPSKNSVTLPSGLLPMLVITAGTIGTARLNTVPLAPGPPPDAVPYSEVPTSNRPPTG